MSDQLIVTIEDGIATLRMNRPDARNALSYELIQELREAVDRVAADPNVRVVVLTGTGNAFCAGGDVVELATRPLYGIDENRFSEDVCAVRLGMETSLRIYKMPKPTLAVMHGASAGAGLALALACDMRIAVDDAKLTTAFSKIGLSGDFGISYYLLQLVGAAKARELLFFSEVITGRQAADLGLVNWAVAAEHIDEKAQKLAARLAELPTFAIGRIKENLNTANRSSLADLLDCEADNLVRCFARSEFAAAVARFVAKEGVPGLRR